MSESASPMDLCFWPGAVVMMLIATLTASLVTNGGRSTWFVGTLVLMVYLVFAMTLYCCPRPGNSRQLNSSNSLHRPAQ